MSTSDYKIEPDIEISGYLVKKLFVITLIFKLKKKENFLIFLKNIKTCIYRVFYAKACTNKNYLHLLMTVLEKLISPKAFGLSKFNKKKKNYKFKNLNENYLR